MSGALTLTAGQLNTGSTLSRWENTGVSLPAGAAGIGFEIVGNSAATGSLLFSYNRTSNQYTPLTFRGSYIESICPWGGGYMARYENTGGAVPTPSAGVGVEIIGNAGGQGVVRSYNRTTAADAPMLMTSSNFTLSGAGMELKGTNPAFTLKGDGSSYYNAIVFDTAYGAASYSIGGYNGCQQNLKAGMFDWMFNSVSKMTLDSNGSLAARYNISGRGGNYNFGPVQGDAIADCIMVISTTNYYPTLTFKTANGAAQGSPLVDCGHFLASAGGMSFLFDQYNFQNKANSVNYLTLNASGAAFTVPITVSGAAVAMVSQLASYAPLASPALTGNPTATTQAAGNNTTRIATTAFVNTAVAANRDVIDVQSAAANSITPVFGDDICQRLAITAAATINAPTGTAIDGWGMVLRLRAAAGQTLAWNAIFRAIGVTLPTALVAGKLLIVGMIYSTDSKWDVTGVMQEA